MLTKQEQIRFYEEELEMLELQVKEDFESNAFSSFDRGKILVGVYKGWDRQRGNIFIDFKNEERRIPRLDFRYNCFVLTEQFIHPSKWGGLTYRDLLKKLNAEVDLSELNVVNFMDSDRPGWIRAICNDAGLSFVQALQHNQVLSLGPVEPPYEYLINLKYLSENLSEQAPNQAWEEHLKFSFRHDENRKPTLVTEEQDIPAGIIKQLEENRIVVLQGPPGTGKTYQVADIVSRLLNNNQSVLVTALTNKASVEVCGKPFLIDFLSKGKVFKTNLSSSEIARHPQLKLAKDLVPEKGSVILTTYYQFSKLWKQYTEPIFDYIVVEEASQAFLTTIAGAIKLAHKVLIVGDPLQIPPIAINPSKGRISPNIDSLIYGLKTICGNTQIPFLRKIETRRLSQRAIDYTNYFYENTIVSKALFTDLSQEITLLEAFGKFVPPLGGPSLLLFPGLAVGKSPKGLEKFLAEFIDKLISIDKNSEIAVLTPFNETTTFLQGKLKSATKSKSYLIETVDRVQGLDVDYCFYVIPADTYVHPLNINRFNVATSRSKKATFIVSSPDLIRMMSSRNAVNEYLLQLFEDFHHDIKN